MTGMHTLRLGRLIIDVSPRKTIVAGHNRCVIPELIREQGFTSLLWKHAAINLVKPNG